MNCQPAYKYGGLTDLSWSTVSFYIYHKKQHPHCSSPYITTVGKYFSEKLQPGLHAKKILNKKKQSEGTF